jgi:hypothetical protein
MGRIGNEEDVRAHGVQQSHDREGVARLLMRAAPFPILCVYAWKRGNGDVCWWKVLDFIGDCDGFSDGNGTRICTRVLEYLERNVKDAKADPRIKTDLTAEISKIAETQRRRRWKIEDGRWLGGGGIVLVLVLEQNRLLDAATPIKPGPSIGKKGAARNLLETA